MENLVSIIMPVYNVASYLRQSVESVLRQTYKKMEIILIDDGSTDESGKICDDLAIEDSRIVVVHKKNEGVAQARNDGLRNANGEYIMFVDSDDMIHPEMLEALMKICEESSVDVVCANYVRVNEYPHFYAQYEEHEWKDKLSYHTGRELLNDIYTDNKEILLSVVWGKLFRKNITESLSFPKGRIHEDEYFTYKIFFGTDKVAFLNMPLYYYLVREGSITNSVCKKNVEDTLGALNERVKFCEEHGLEYLREKTIEAQINTMIRLHWYSEKSEKTRLEHEIKKMFQEHKRIIKQYSLIKKIRMATFSLSPTLYFGIYRLLGKEYK